MSDFVQALISGTVDRYGNDATGLYWTRLGWAQIEEVIRNLAAFAEFCAEGKDAPELVSHVEPSFKERLSICRRYDRQNSHSLFAHIGNAKAKAHELARGVPDIRGPIVPVVVAAERPIYPRDRFADLLVEGFRRRARGALWETHNLRDMMIAILQRHGGLRVSESFHLYVGDVIEDPHAPGHARVQLVHPQIGGIDWLDPITRRVVTIRRDDYLRRKFDRLPRNQMTGSQRAGWKNLRLERGAPRWSVPVYWWPRVWGAIFWQLYLVYLDRLLPRGLTHPYLFVALDGANQGEPLTLQAYADSLARANERIGLETGKAYGTTSHGFRFAYAQDLGDIKFHREVIQACLHHVSPMSQDVYTRAELSTVRDSLDAGHRRLSEGTVPSFMPSDAVLSTVGSGPFRSGGPFR